MAEPRWGRLSDKSANDLWKLLEDLDLIAASATFGGPIDTAVGIVDGLQDAGPAWTGKFRNSWQITTPSGKTFRCKNFKQAGIKSPIQRPKVKGQEVVKAKIFKDPVIFDITNVSEHKEYALDEKLGIFDRFHGGPEPIKEPVSEGGSRSGLTLRGDASSGTGEASSTAELDWFKNFLDGKKVDKVIRIEMDRVVKRTKRQSKGRIK